MKPHNFLTIAVLFAFAGFFNGCATTRTDLVREGIVSVVRLPSGQQNPVRTAHIYKTNGDITISGKVNVPYSHRGHPHKHVDIMILNPDDTISVRTTASLSHRHRPRVDRRSSSYFARIPVTPAAGSKIQVINHAGSVKPECSFTSKVSG